MAPPRRVSRDIPVERVCTIVEDDLGGADPIRPGAGLVEMANRQAKRIYVSCKPLGDHRTCDHAQFA
ncbi:hypothetical protein ACVIDN_006076 [Rhizobium brockwellii]